MVNINSHVLGTSVPTTGCLLKQWNTRLTNQPSYCSAQSSWNAMDYAQKPDFVFRAKRTSPFKSAEGRQFSRLLAAEVSVSAVVMLDTPCSEVVWRVLATHYILQFPPSLPIPCVTVCHHISTWVYLDWRVGLLFLCSDRLPVDGPQVPKMWELMFIIRYILGLLLDAFLR